MTIEASGFEHIPRMVSLVLVDGTHSGSTCQESDLNVLQSDSLDSADPSSNTTEVEILASCMSDHDTVSPPAMAIDINPSALSWSSDDTTSVVTSVDLSAIQSASAAVTSVQDLNISNMIVSEEISSPPRSAAIVSGMEA